MGRPPGARTGLPHWWIFYPRASPGVVARTGPPPQVDLLSVGGQTSGWLGQVCLIGLIFDPWVFPRFGRSDRFTSPGGPSIRGRPSGEMARTGRPHWSDLLSGGCLREVVTRTDQPPQAGLLSGGRQQVRTGRSHWPDLRSADRCGTRRDRSTSWVRPFIQGLCARVSTGHSSQERGNVEAKGLAGWGALAGVGPSGR